MSGRCRSTLMKNDNWIWTPDAEANARAGVQNVMQDEPDLTYAGFGICEGVPRLSDEERRRQFEMYRTVMLTPEALREFSHACFYLSRIKRTKNINSHSSYHLKHMAEKTSPTHYISNGMLIAAALYLGLKYRRYGPNASFNLSCRLP